MANFSVAPALLQLRAQLNDLAPRRNRRSDGTVGDAAHRSRKSDHNPWFKGSVVTAMDITHDPVNGMSGDTLASTLANVRDPRVKYIIWNRRIFSKRSGRWAWRSYNGPNPHTSHVHLSIQPNASYASKAAWDLSAIANELRLGRRSPAVKALQEQLHTLIAAKVMEIPQIDADGDFGPATEAAVRQFQRQSRLAIDGFAGRGTLAALGPAAAAAKARANQTELPITVPGVETVAEEAQRKWNEVLDVPIKREGSVLGGQTSLAAVIANFDAAVELIVRHVDQLSADVAAVRSALEEKEEA